jgi:hypothetical protein
MQMWFVVTHTIRQTDIPALQPVGLQTHLRPKSCDKKKNTFSRESGVFKCWSVKDLSSSSVLRKTVYRWVGQIGS